MGFAQLFKRSQEEPVSQPQQETKAELAPELNNDLIEEIDEALAEEEEQEPYVFRNSMEALGVVEEQSACGCF